MFNLEQAIGEWRRQMTAGGIKSSSILEELESHLREDVERQMRAGADAAKAFEMAVQKIGSAGTLKNEFKKSAIARAMERLMITAAVLVMAFGAFLSIVTLVLCYRGMQERLMGFVAISLSFATVWGWRAFVSRLPIVQPKRKREFIQVTCLLAGFGISTFYVQVILPHFERHGDGMIPAIGFFAVFPIAIGFALAAGLDRAARRDSEPILA